MARPRRPEVLDDAALEGVVDQQFPPKVRRRRGLAPASAAPHDAAGPVEVAVKVAEVLDTPEQIEEVGRAAEMTVTAEEVEALWSQELLDLIQNTAAAFAEAATQPAVGPKLAQPRDFVEGQAAEGDPSQAPPPSETREAAGFAPPTTDPDEPTTGTTEVPTMQSEPHDPARDGDQDTGTATEAAVDATTEADGGTAETATGRGTDDAAVAAEAAIGTPAQVDTDESPATEAEAPPAPADAAGDPAPPAEAVAEAVEATDGDAIDFDELTREAEDVVAATEAFTAAEPREPARPDDEADDRVPDATHEALDALFGERAPSTPRIADPMDGGGAATATMVPTVVALAADDSLALRQIRTDVQALEHQQKNLVASIDTVRQDVRETKIDTAANTRATVEALASLRTLQGRLVAESRARAKALTTPIKTPIVLGIAVLAISWGLACYFKTGNLALALGGVVAANLLGCAAMFARGR